MSQSDALALYNAKRDFARTAEPAGTLAPGQGNGFMVQKHDATRLHWDFRIEVDGVLLDHEAVALPGCERPCRLDRKSVV